MRLSAFFYVGNTFRATTLYISVATKTHERRQPKMARSFVKGTLQMTSIDENKKKENVSLGHVVANASLEDVTAVRDAVGTLVKHPITETKVTEVYAYN